MSTEGMARDIARELARAEVRALTEALTEAFGATLFSHELSADELGAGLRDVVKLWSSEVERRIPGWIGTDPDASTVSTASTDEENPMRSPLSDKDQKAAELAKMTRRDPQLRERVRKVDEARAGKEPIEKQHPVSKMSGDSPVLADWEAEILDKMSSENVSAEVAVGLLSRDPAFHVMKSDYKAEQRAFRGA